MTQDWAILPMKLEKKDFPAKNNQIWLCPGPFLWNFNIFSQIFNLNELGLFFGLHHFDIGLFLGAFWCHLGALFSLDLATLPEHVASLPRHSADSLASASSLPLLINWHQLSSFPALQMAASKTSCDSLTVTYGVHTKLYTVWQEAGNQSQSSFLHSFGLQTCSRNCSN